MSFFEKIKSLFVKKDKKVDSHSELPKEVKSPRQVRIEDLPQQKGFSVTEATLCRTSYGIGKLKEDGNKRYLIFPQRLDVRYVPFVENNYIEAVYTINPEDFGIDEKGRYVYEILESAQFFMLSKEQKEEISNDLRQRGINYKFPEEIDNYSTVMEVLRASTLLMRNQDAHWYDKDKFLSEILEIKGSNTYKELHLIRTKNGQRFLLIINQIIPNVIEYGPSFMNLYEPGAVKISYKEGYAFIAPFGKPR